MVHGISGAFTTYHYHHCDLCSHTSTCCLLPPRHYVFQFCSPTRSAMQSGRNPIHVNTQNGAPQLHNPADTVSGFAGIPRNMTGNGCLRLRLRLFLSALYSFSLSCEKSAARVGSCHWGRLKLADVIDNAVATGPIGSGAIGLGY